MPTKAATVEHVTWWGLYELNNPPISETMRIRFYNARPSDGLPGDIFAEQVFTNPARAATGVVVEMGPLGGSPVDALEYRYEVNLVTAVTLQAERRR